MRAPRRLATTGSALARAYVLDLEEKRTRITRVIPERTTRRQEGRVDSLVVDRRIRAAVVYDLAGTVKLIGFSLRKSGVLSVDQLAARFDANKITIGDGCMS